MAGSRPSSSLCIYVRRRLPMRLCHGMRRILCSRLGSIKSPLHRSGRSSKAQPTFKLSAVSSHFSSAGSTLGAGATVVAAGPRGAASINPSAAAMIDSLCFLSCRSTVLFALCLPSDWPCSEYAALSTASVSASRNRQHTGVVSTTSEPGR